MSEERLSELLQRVTPEPPGSIDLGRMAERIVDDMELSGPVPSRRKLLPALTAAAAVIAIAVASVTVVVHRADQLQPSGGSGPAPSGKEVQRARDVLKRWDKAVGNNAYTPIAPSPGQGSNPATWQFRQVGDWPGTTGRPTPDVVGLALRLIAEKTPLPTTRPPAGKVLWAGGGSAPVEVLSPAETLQLLRSGADVCVGCATGEIDGVKGTTLQISKVSLTTMQVQTTRGPATVPAYLFSFTGKAVQVLQAAVNVPAVGPMPATEQFNLPIDSATLSPDRLSLTVRFTGAAKPGTEPCGADYGAYAVETDTAVAVIVTEKQHGGNEACPGDGREREAVIDLKTPLGSRAVLETSNGTAVRVTG